MPRGNSKRTKPKRTYRRKRQILGRPNRLALRPSIYQFKRQVQETIILSNAATPEGWTASNNGYYKQFVYSLSQLGDNTDFTNLFQQYKICAVKQEFMLSNNTSSDNNAQLLIYWDNNPQGQSITLDEPYYLTTQTSRKRVVQTTTAKPTKFFTKVKQLSNVFSGVTNNDYAMTWPKYIGTDEPTCPHYGINLRVQRVDGQQFGQVSSNFQYLKIITTYYITCRKVV